MVSSGNISLALGFYFLFRTSSEILTGANIMPCASV